MKHALWLINSSLVLIFALVLGVLQLLHQEPPPWRMPQIFLAQEQEKKEEAPKPGTTAWEKIYQDDIFGTYTPVEIKAVKQSLLTPIPEPKTFTPPPPPEIKKPEIIPALNITLRGIIIGGDESKNVVMIADEAGKEDMYHLGEKIKDAQIIKIAHNRVVLLRANGQQEVFYLRKDDIPTPQDLTEKWKYIVKKVNDQSFEIDPQEFCKEIETLGHLIERASVVGTAYQAGKPVGIRVGKSDPNDIATMLGILENDIITSVNGLDVANPVDRIKAYDTVTQLGLGGQIQVGLKRAEKDVVLAYKLVKIDKPRKSRFPGVRIAEANKPPTQEELLKMNRLQQQENTTRQFQQGHQDAAQQQRQQQTIMDIRKRILEGLQQRLKNNPNQ